jgi:hypothetical protein
MIGSNFVYSQSQQYANQMLQKASNLSAEINKELQRSSQFAMRSSIKEIYILYLNGNKLAVFADEWSCKAQINSIKLRIESLMESFITGLPRDIPRSEITQIRNSMKNYLNNMNFTYRKEKNPNYRKSGFSDKNNGFDSDDVQGNKGKTLEESLSVSKTDTKKMEVNPFEALSVR